MQSCAAESWKIASRSLKSHTRRRSWRNECVKYWTKRRTKSCPRRQANHESRAQSGFSRSVHPVLPAGMDQVGARAGVDQRLDGDRVVYVHELLGAPVAPESLDRLVDVLFGIPRRVDRAG